MANSSDSDYDSADSDKELQVAFSEGLIKPGLNVETKPKKTFINDVEGLKACTARFKNDLPWCERLDLVLEPMETAKPLEELQRLKAPMVEDVEDDFQRELMFYRLAQSGVYHGLPLLKTAGIPTKRPEDYFAEMAKSDVHMDKIRKKLLAKHTSLERSEKAKKLRELRKFGKKVQVENIQRKHKEKKDMLEAVKRYRKGKESSLDFLEDFKSNKKDSKQKSGPHQPNKKRQAKNKKFGFGGQKKRSKSNTKDSVNDMSGYSAKKHNNKASGKGGKSVKQRPGKQRRNQAKNRKK